MKKNIIILASLLFLVESAVGNFVNAEDWPTFHHDTSLSGYTTSFAPDTNERLWVYQTDGRVESSPAIADGKVYVGSQDGNLYCLDKYTGDLVWKEKKDNGIIQSSPAVSDGKVYYLSSSGIMYCLNTDDGSLIWQIDFGRGSWDWSSPAIHNENVFIGSSRGPIYSLNAADGSINWSTDIGGTSDSPITVANGKVYSGTHNFGNNDATMVALNESTGDIIWTYDYHLYHNGVTGMVNYNGATVADGDGDGYLEVYFGVYNWNGVADQAVCLDEVTGHEIWTQDIKGSSTSTPAFHDGKIFIGSDDHNLYALDAATGAYLWNFTTDGQVWSAPAVSGDGKVCFGSLDHTVYCVTENTGHLIWSYFTGHSRVISSPAISDGMLVVGNENGKVYAFGKPNQPPVAQCKNAFASLDANGNLELSASDIDNDSFDPDGDPITLNVSPTSFDCSDVGVNSVLLTVTDDQGAFSSCEAEVIVQDEVAPIVYTKDITIQLGSSGNASIATEDIDNGTSDACGIASLSVAPSSFTCSNVGKNTVTLTATDVNGNTSSATATVTVEDNIAPIIAANALDTIIPPDAPISFTATATDNCSATVEIMDYRCYGFTGNGKEHSKMQSCVVSTSGDTLTITDSGGVGDNIAWTITATDQSGNTTTTEGHVLVVNPGKSKK
ncbi:MAG: PQQ-binding-like beta-propeller repeat protein [Candidatus Electrothrix communis]|nr:MAG: PQQ-binding-like beta-propeller repeat protein [Candidatus Electrothrix communis]